MFPDKPAQKIDIQLCQNKLEGKKYIFWKKTVAHTKNNLVIYFTENKKYNLNALYSTDNEQIRLIICLKLLAALFFRIFFCNIFFGPPIFF